MNKKRIVSILCVLTAILSIFGITACKREHTHTWGSWSVTVEATCLVDGSQKRTCSDCGEVETQVISALGHNFAEYLYNEDATCDANGTETATCSNTGCEETDTREKEETILEHVFSEYVSDDNATCTANGTETAICSNGECEETDTREIENSKIPHVFSEYVSDNNGTCKNGGTETATCAECGEKDTRNVDGVAYSCNYKLVVDNATCTKQGEKTYRCSGCGDTIKEPSPAKGHVWDDTITCGHEAKCKNCDKTKTVEHEYVKISTTQTTCEEDGYYLFKCNNCNDEYEEVYEVAIGHMVSVWAFDSEEKKSGATCVYNQTFIGYCYGCQSNVTKTKEVEKHSLKASILTEATCQIEGVMKYACSEAGCTHSYTSNFSSSSAHKWDNGTEVEGVITYTCIHNCGETKSVISKKNEVQATVDKNAIGEVGEVELKNASIALDSSVIDNLGSSDVTIGADKFDSVDNLTGITVTEETKAAIGDEPIYNFTLTNGGAQLDNGLGGIATVRIPYTLQDGDDPECLAIWWITYDEQTQENVLQEIEVEYSNGYIWFETDHFSYYTVTRLTPAERCKLYGHSYKVFETEPTCTTDGFKFSVCQRCGNSVKEITELATGHNVQEVENQRKDVTCTENGKRVYQCVNEANGIGCAYSYAEILKAEGHDWAETGREEPTCEKPGHVNKKCVHCQKETKEDLLQKQHDFKVKESVKATCKNGGHTVYECEDCGYTYTGDKVKALGHNYVKTVIEPTCTEDGYTLEKCTRCDDSKTSHNVKAGHEWNIKKPTCGQSQICINCGVEGGKATGKHKIEDGICTVCGEGCEHNFTETIIKATCTEEGYTKKVCSICNAEETYNYVKATGHKGEVACEYCGEKMISGNFFQNMLDSATNDSFAIVITNFAVYDKYYMTSGDNAKYTITTMEFVEFSIGISSEGKLTGYAYGTANIEDEYYQTNGKVEFEACIKDNVFYAKFLGDNMSSSTRKEEIILRGSIEDLFDMGEEGLGTVVTALIKDYKKELLPIFNQFVSENSEKVNEIMGNFVELLFVTEETKDGYVLTLDFAKAKALNERLASEDADKLIDSLLGDGTYAKLGDKIDEIADKTVGYYLNEFYKRGYTKNEMVDLIYTITSVFDEEITKQDIKEEFFDNKEITDMKISEVIEESADIDWEDISDYIHDLLDEIKGYSVYEIIVALDDCDGDLTDISFDGISEEVRDVKNAVDEMIDMVADCARLSITTEKSGKLVNIDFGINVDKVVSGDFKIIRDYTSTHSFDQLIEEVSYVADGFGIDHRVFTTSLLTNYPSPYAKDDVKEKDGHLYVLTNTYSNSYFVDERREGEYLIQTHEYQIEERYIVIDKNALAIFNADCGNWWRLDLEYKWYTNHLSQQEERKFDLYGNLISATPVGEIDSWYNGGYYSSFDVLYNHVTGEVKSAINNYYYNATMHNYLLDESKSVAAEGCEGIGKMHYSCSLCGDSYTNYYTNGHQTYHTVELMDGSTTCEDGVIEKTVCYICEKTVYEYECYYHSYGIIKRIKVPSVCGGYIDVRGCACGYDGGYIERYNTNCDLDWTRVEYENSYNYTEIATCAVSEPLCGYRFALEYYTVDISGETCLKDSYVKIHLGCDENGNNAKDGTEVIYLGQVEIHNYEYKEVSLNYCLKAGMEVCLDCGDSYYHGWYDSYHQTTWYDNIDAQGNGTSGYKCDNCDYMHEETYVNDVLVSEKETNYSIQRYDKYGYDVFWYEKYEEVTLYEVAEDGYNDRQTRTRTTTMIFPDNISEEIKADIINMYGGDRTEYYSYLYFYEEGFERAFEEWTGREYDVTRDGCAYLECRNYGDEQYVWGLITACDRSSEFVNTGTCTQFRYWKYHCERCGCDFVDDWYNYPNAENYDGHNYYADYDEYGEFVGYKCSICGIESVTGADGSVILENSSHIDNDADTVIIGYYMRWKDYYEQANYASYYIPSITLILHDVADGEDQILVEGVNISRYDGDGNYLVYSLSEVQMLAQAMGYEIGEYDIRLSFVPVGGSGDLDYGITITAEEINQMQQA